MVGDCSNAQPVTERLQIKTLQRQPHCMDLNQKLQTQQLSASNETSPTYNVESALEEIIQLIGKIIEACN